MEGSAVNRLAVIQFADFDTVIACHKFPEYQKALEAREKYSEAHSAVVEGV